MKTYLIIILLALFTVTGHGQTAKTKLRDLNVKHMTRGYFHAGSIIKDKNELGGYYAAKNYPRAATKEMASIKSGVRLIAKPDASAIFARKFRGMKVLLVNATSEVVSFPAQDSRLNIVQEALDRKGSWKPVEYLPSSWCGNSYHKVFLGKREYWEFAAAKYNGKFKTRLRFKLTYNASVGPKTIYSNEFSGSINKSQFKLKKRYKPNGIMDPYTN